MSVLPVVPGVYQLSLGMVNVFFLDQDGVTIIDSGTPGSAPKILAALGEIGKGPKDVRQILVTHLHADHTGSVKALKEALVSSGGTGIKVMMHARDAETFQQGKVIRPARPAPGLLGKLLGGLISWIGPGKVEPASVDSFLEDGEEIPYTGGLRVVFTPGHTAGHLAFLWPKEGGVLFAGDAARNMGRLNYPFIFEDFEQGKQTLQSMAELQFETAVFSHGSPVRTKASALFREMWG